MRPASEINSALDLCESDLSRAPDNVNLLIARDVLAWAMGKRAPDDGPTLWLVAYLLDDPSKIDDVDPTTN